MRPTCASCLKGNNAVSGGHCRRNQFNSVRNTIQLNMRSEGSEILRVRFERNYFPGVTDSFRQGDSIKSNKGPNICNSIAGQHRPHKSFPYIRFIGFANFPPPWKDQ